MPNIYEMNTRQVLTDGGKCGVWLTLGSSVVSTMTWFWPVIMYGRDAEFNAISPAVLVLLLAACGFAFIGGCILLLIGREQVTTVRRVARTKPDEQLWR